MRVADSLALVREALPSLLPAAWRAFQWRQLPGLLQVYYWYPAVHYELWLQQRRGLVEVGLHFEGEREHNHRWAQALSENMALVQASLSRPADLEEWTGWWTRLHYLLPWEPLGQEVALRWARELASFIVALQPLMEEWRKSYAIPASRLTGPPRARRRIR